MAVETYANNESWTVGVGGISNVATSLPVSAVATGNIATGQFKILVESELMTVTAGNATTTWTVTRGDEGTTAVAHLAGAAITHIISAASLIRAVEGRAVVASADASYNFSLATGLWLPQSAGAAPANTGQIAHDTTQRATNVRDSVFGVASLPRTLKASYNGSDTLSAATGTTEQNFATTLVLPANYFIVNKLIWVIATFVYTSSSTPPTKTIKLKLGSTVLFLPAIVAAFPASKTSNAVAYWWQLACGTVAAGSAPINCGFVNPYDGGTAPSHNATAQPVTVAVNASQTLTASITYSATTAGNTTTLGALSVMELN